MMKPTYLSMAALLKRTKGPAVTVYYNGKRVVVWEAKMETVYLHNETATQPSIAMVRVSGWRTAMHEALEQRELPEGWPMHEHKHAWPLSWLLGDSVQRPDEFAYSVVFFDVVIHPTHVNMAQGLHGQEE